MTTVKILGICGSLQATSANRTLLTHAATAMPQGVEFKISDGLKDLPHFNPDIEAAGVPDAVVKWRRSIEESEGLLIATPEYGFSLPGSLKNGIDWVIGSGELEQKVVAFTAAVPGPERGRRGLQALRDTLTAVRATMVGGEPIIKGDDFGAQVRALVQALVDAAGSSPGKRSE
jgi:chromate reductase, NAD(P)H dehydrogenase (quinone)